jgi:Tfp pilus assembly protein PilO
VKKTSKNAKIALVVIGLLVYAAAGYFLLVGRQGSKAADLAEQVVAVQSQITEARLATARAAAAPKEEPVRVADLFRLSKAMPDQTDMPGVLLELNRVARETGIEFQSIAPAASLPADGFQIVPIDLVFEGNYYDLADFLFRTRTLVGVRDGRLDARGRLFNVEKIEFAEGKDSFPEIRATIRLETYVFGAGAPATTVAGAVPATGAPTAPAPATPPATPAPTPPPPATPDGATAMGTTP